MFGKATAGFATGAALLTSLPLLAVGSLASPSRTAVTEIPGPFLALYQDAASQRCPGLPWTVLAAVGSVESNHGRIGGAGMASDGTVTPAIIGPVLDGSDGTARIVDTDGGRLDGDPSYDRAVGPMQFLPATWASYGFDASGDGRADPHNAVDAVHSAAVYLCANGGGEPDRLADAILAYNRSVEYVHEVLATADRYDHASSVVSPTETLIAMVLANPRLSIYAAGRTDIERGRIDARVLLFLQAASERWTLGVSSLQTGHSKCVGGGDYDGCNVSNHWYGRAVDIYRVDGQLVSSRNSAARALAQWALRLGGDFGPRELGSPWPSLSPIPGAFSDASHRAHLHVGWDE